MCLRMEVTGPMGKEQKREQMIYDDQSVGWCWKIKDKVISYMSLVLKDD
jgi:hypothetical protein